MGHIHLCIAGINGGKVWLIELDAHLNHLVTLPLRGYRLFGAENL